MHVFNHKTDGAKHHAHNRHGHDSTGLPSSSREKILRATMPAGVKRGYPSRKTSGGAKATAQLNQDIKMHKLGGVG